MLDGLMDTINGLGMMGLLTLLLLFFGLVVVGLSALIFLMVRR